jgi:hypothetical protein
MASVKAPANASSKSAGSVSIIPSICGRSRTCCHHTLDHEPRLLLKETSPVKRQTEEFFLFVAYKEIRLRIPRAV